MEMYVSNINRKKKSTMLTCSLTVLSFMSFIVLLILLTMILIQLDNDLFVKFCFKNYIKIKSLVSLLYHLVILEVKYDSC